MSRVKGSGDRLWERRGNGRLVAIRDQDVYALSISVLVERINFKLIIIINNYFYKYCFV